MDQTPAFGDGSWYPKRFDLLAGRPNERGFGVDDIRLGLASMFAFLAPFNILRVDAVYFTAGDAVAVVLLLVMIFSRSLYAAPWGTGNLLWNVGASAFVGSMLASSLLHGSPDRGFIVSGQYLFAFVVVGFIVLSLSARELAVVTKFFVASIAVVCLHGIYVINVVGQTYTTFVSGNGRFLGFVERENECGVLIALAVPLLLWLVRSGNARLHWLLVGLPLLAYGVTLTGSNTALMVLVYGLVASVVLAGSWRHVLLAGASTGALFAVVVNWGRDFLPPAFQRRVLGALETGDFGEAGTFLDRVALIREAWEKTERSMLLGIGADQYRVISAFHAPVHNVYLLLWTEAGFLGLVGYVTMFIAALLMAFAAFKARGGRLAACCTLTTVTQFLIAGNTFPHMYGRYLVVPLFLSTALSVVAVREGGIRNGRATRAG